MATSRGYRQRVLPGRYGIDILVYAEPHDSIVDAIAREKAIKKCRRVWKVALIEKDNPDWHDLWFDLDR